MSEIFRLRRTGHPPLVFEGRMIAEATGEIFQDTGGKLKHHYRWYEASVYREVEGLWAWSIRYRTTWRNEINHDTAGWAVSESELVEAIRTYNPLGPVAGMPFNERTNWRQDQLLQALRLAWGEVASELFEAAGIADIANTPQPIRVFLLSSAQPSLLRTRDGHWRPLREAMGGRDDLLGFSTLAEAGAACEALKTAGVDVKPFTLD